MLMIMSVLGHAHAASSSPHPVGTYQVDESDVTYARASGADLQAHIYRPQLKEALPAISTSMAGRGAWAIACQVDVLAAYQDQGGCVTYQFYPNQAHAFGHRPSAATDHLVSRMRDFIAASLR
ncbi:MAG TPA: hypothetical protein VNA21_06960 [Steroidobacteraceae bacterium]|nr:hypothetical protein [Steroidobacteraceae bacterium]